MFRSRLDQIIAMHHELVQLAQEIHWEVLEQWFGEVYSDGPRLDLVLTNEIPGILDGNILGSLARFCYEIAADSGEQLEAFEARKRDFAGRVGR